MGLTLGGTDVDAATLDAAASAAGRRRAGAPPEPAPPHAVTPPADNEVYEYLGPQMRWIHLLMLVAFGLAAWSLCRA